MNTTDIMKDPFFAPILFEIERRILTCVRSARAAGIEINDSQIRSTLNKVRKTSEGGKPQIPDESPREKALAGLHGDLLKTRAGFMSEDSEGHREAARRRASHDEHLSGRLQSRAVLAPRGAKEAGAGPETCPRIVNFGTGKSRAAAASPGDENFSTGQQRGGVTVARRGERARGAPYAGSRIVEFDACERTPITSASDEHLAIGQQRGRVTGASRGERTGNAPGACRWIKEGRICEISAIESPRDEDLAIGQQRRGLIDASKWQ